MRFVKTLFCQLLASGLLLLSLSVSAKETTVLPEKYVKLTLGDTTSLRQALKEGVPLDAVDKKGSSLLMLAAFRGDLLQMKFLIAAGADINQRNKQNILMMLDSPLDYAVRGYEKEAVDLLLVAGDDINKKDRLGLPAVYRCVLFPNYNMLSYLLKKGATIDKELGINMMVSLFRVNTISDNEPFEIAKLILQQVGEVKEEEIRQSKWLDDKTSSSLYASVDKICNRILSVQQTIFEKMDREERERIAEERKMIAEQHRQDSLKHLLESGQVDTIRYKYAQTSYIDSYGQTHTEIEVYPRLDYIKNRLAEKEVGIVFILVLISMLVIYLCIRLSSKYMTKEKGYLSVHYVVGFLVGGFCVSFAFFCIYDNLDEIMVRKNGEEKSVFFCNMSTDDPFSPTFGAYPKSAFLLFREDSVRMAVGLGEVSFDADDYGGEDSVRVTVRYDAAAKKLAVDNDKYFQQNMIWISAMCLLLLLIISLYGKFTKWLDTYLVNQAKKSEEEGDLVGLPSLLSTSWTLTSQEYESLDDFLCEVKDSEQMAGRNEDTSLHPDEMILEDSCISVGVLESNLVVEDDFLSLDITPFNGEYITEGELLFQFHNQMIPHLDRLVSCKLVGIALLPLAPNEGEEKAPTVCLAIFE